MRPAVGLHRPRLLVVGCGDVGMRLVRRLAQTRGRHLAIIALTRDPARRAALRALGVRSLAVDLDARHHARPGARRRLGGLADWVVDLAPPPATGEDDPRSARLIESLQAGGTLRPAAAFSSVPTPLRPARPHRWVYVSTTGVYGDAGGARFDETRTPNPAHARGRRRLVAERRWRAGALSSGARLAILRVPGIYAHDRLPLERLRRGTPALQAGDDVFTNHIHADDLARAILAALWRGRPNRIYHAVDDTEMLMGDYFDQVADRHGLPRPPRLSREAIAEVVSAAQLSFMSESRRLRNTRLKQELRLRLLHPSVQHALADGQGPML